MTLVTQFDRSQVNKLTTTYLKREELLCEGGRTLLYVDNNGDTDPCLDAMTPFCGIWNEVKNERD